jgi:pyruvate dehydrogenase E2 component (dihydrolipoamide acetyltransferase)
MLDGSAAIINYPEVAILGLGGIIARPWVVGARCPSADRSALARVRSPQRSSDGLRRTR